MQVNGMVLREARRLAKARLVTVDGVFGGWYDQIHTPGS
jgi:hypothetical protein